MGTSLANGCNPEPGPRRCCGFASTQRVLGSGLFIGHDHASVFTDDVVQGVFGGDRLLLGSLCLGVGGKCLYRDVSDLIVPM